MNFEQDPKQGDFLEGLISLLGKSKSITKEEYEQALTLLKQKKRESQRVALSSKGKCINCKTHTAYGELVQAHIQKGDQWLDEKMGKWKTPPFIKVPPGLRDAKEVLVNGLRIYTVLTYCCEACSDSIVESANRLLEKHFEDIRKQNEREQKKDQAILEGKISGSPAKAYWLLRQEIARSSEEVKEDLRTLPYKEFLQTRYWEIVRNYVRYKRGYVCELCGSRERLHVHHKTYEHHGQEHNYLEDLVLLCAQCHSRHHEKLYHG